MSSLTDMLVKYVTKNKLSKEYLPRELKDKINEYKYLDRRATWYYLPIEYSVWNEQLLKFREDPGFLGSSDDVYSLIPDDYRFTEAEYNAVRSARKINLTRVKTHAIRFSQLFKNRITPSRGDIIYAEGKNATYIYDGTEYMITQESHRRVLFPLIPMKFPTIIEFPINYWQKDDSVYRIDIMTSDSPRLDPTKLLYEIKRNMDTGNVEDQYSLYSLIDLSKITLVGQVNDIDTYGIYQYVHQFQEDEIEIVYTIVIKISPIVQPPLQITDPIDRLMEESHTTYNRPLKDEEKRAVTTSMRDHAPLVSTPQAIWEIYNANKNTFLYFTYDER